jgi:hypothetical protein
MKGLTPVDNSRLASCLVRAALYLNEWCLGLVRISRSRLASRIDPHGLLSVGTTTAAYARRKLRATKRLISLAE